ncbi:hypothetical protein CAL7716_107160 (plasmid) [Calothrix sp. PCC 7716]|nr:hypothetical protein CAL7716_107160 [Calothrix sp. PCC 7716]
MRIRDLVSGRGNNVLNRLQNDLGFSVDTLNKQTLGDEQELKTLRDTHKEAQFINEFLPQIADQWIDIINAQGTYNEKIADIISAGSKYGLKVSEAQAATVLTEGNYNNGITEIDAELVAARSLQDTKHKDEMEFISMQAEIVNAEYSVDAKDKLIKLVNRPYLKQLKTDTDYKKARMKHILEHGSDSELERINYKDYVAESSNPVTRILAKLGFVFS